MERNRDFFSRMLRPVLIAVAAIGMCYNASARPLTREQAMDAARTFMSQRGDARCLAPVTPVSALGRMKAAARGAATVQPYYVFNRGEQEGFVIIAGDDRSAESVLGYCDSGVFDYDQMPPNMLEWLDGYAQQLEAMQKEPDSPEAAARSVHRITTHPAVAQLMSSQWSQGAPYNDECPMYFNLGRSVTGCVATAYAQILYYHREKMVTETQAAMPAYKTSTSHPTLGQLSVDGIPAGSPIDWDGMQDTYGGGSSARAKKAVAQLMHYCGVGVKMDYTNSASGAQSYDVYTSLKTYFGFGSNLRYVDYSTVTSDDTWDELAYAELAAGRPFYISGANAEGGHAFVCDGYNGDRKYHINWGWGGTSDGFYYLSNLTPGQQGIGGSSDGYNAYRQCIMGIEPENYAEKAMKFSDTNARKLCTAAFDQDGDGSLSYGEAAAVTSLGTVLKGSTIKSFNELHYFTSLTSIDDDAFSGCTQLASVQMPKHIKHIGDRAFKDCEKLQTLILPDALRELGSEAFAGCKALKSLDLPQGLRTVADGTFDGCTALTEMALPTSVTRVGSRAFAGCTALQTFIVNTMQPQDITLGDDVFAGAAETALLRVMQGTRAFFLSSPQWQHFANVKEVRDISGGRFAQLEEGKQFYLMHLGTGRYLTKGEAYGTQAVVSTASPMRFVPKHLSSMPDGVYQLTSDDTGRNGKYLFRTSTDGNVGNGVAATFVDGTSLTKNAHWKIEAVGDNTYTLSVPEGYTGYDAACRWGVQTDHKSNAASPTWGVYSDIVYEGNEQDCLWRFVAYDADQAANYEAARQLETLVAMAKARRISCQAEQTVLDNVESTTQELRQAQRVLRQKLNLMDFEDATVREKIIENFDIDADGELSNLEATQILDLGQLFYGLPITTFDELEKFTNLTELYGNSFEGCTSLTSITLPASVERIYYRVFRNCSKLTSINIPEYVCVLGANTFEGCTSLKTVSIAVPDPASISLGTNLFARVSLKDATLEVPVGSKVLYEQAPVWKDFGTIVEVRTRTQPSFSPIAEGVVGYVMNVATRKFLNKGEAYGTQSVVSRKGVKYEWRRSKTMPEGQYYLFSPEINKGVLFRTSTDTKVGEGVKACFADGNVGPSAYWQVDSVAENTYTLSVPATDATYVNGDFLGTDANHVTDAASPTDGVYWDIPYATQARECQWVFISLADMQAAQAVDESVSQLKQLLKVCQQKDIETEKEQAVYDNLLSTAEELSDAVASLRAKLHYIDFGDSQAKTICLGSWDEDGDGELTFEEAATVTDIGETFRNQSGLRSLEALRYFTALTEIPENAFRQSASLHTIYLPEKVKSLGKTAFMACSSLKFVVLLNEDAVVPMGMSSMPKATIFVPENLVDAYTADASWQSYSITAYTGKPVVRALEASRQYGRSAAKTSYVVEGAPIVGEPVLSCDELNLATAPVGTYTIHVEKGTITTRGVEYVDGELTVLPAPLTITAKSYTRKVGEENPQFEVTYKGFRNRENSEVLDSQPQTRCDATAASPAGAYVIYVEGAEAKNYEIEYVNGTLTVEEASGIAAVKDTTAENAAVYDLQGRKVVDGKQRKGVYLTRDRRKVTVR